MALLTTLPSGWLAYAIAGTLIAVIVRVSTISPRMTQDKKTTEHSVFDQKH